MFMRWLRSNSVLIAFMATIFVIAGQSTAQAQANGNGGLNCQGWTLPGDPNVLDQQQNNNLDVTCNGNWSEVQLLCRDGNDCGSLVTTAPLSAADSPQDNLFFQSVPSDVMIRVCNPNLSSTGGGNNDEPVQYDLDGIGNNLTLNENQGIITHNFEATMTNPPHSIGVDHTGGSPDDFGALAYQVKCTPRGDLKIIKNTNGGDGSFTIVADPVAAGNNVNYPISTTNGMGMDTQSVPIGDYDISETPPGGWTLDSIVCTHPVTQANTGTTATVVEGETTECVVTNTKDATVEIRKTVVGGPGGNFEFDSTVNALDAANTNYNPGTTTVSSTTISAPFNAIDVQEIDNTGGLYNLTSASCELSGGGGAPANGPGTLNTDTLTFTPAAGEDIVCTFQNDFVPQQDEASVTIRKTTIGGLGGQFSFDADDAMANATGADTLDASMVAVGGGQTDVFISTATIDVSQNPTITISEVIDSGAYDATSADCELAAGGDLANPATPGTNSVSFDPSDGENIVCTFVNTGQTGSLTIIKETNPDGDPTVFSFTGNGPAGAINFDKQDNQAGEVFAPVGVYAINETPVAGFNLSDVSCTGDFGQGAGGDVANTNVGIHVTLESGEDITCTFTNRRRDDPDRDPPMEEETKRFINRRVDNLLTHGPDRARMLRRLQEHQPSLKDGPLKLAGNSNDRQGAAPAMGLGMARTAAGTPFSGPRTSSSLVPGVSIAHNANDDVPGRQSDLFGNEANNDGYDPLQPKSTTTSILSGIAGKLLPLANGGTQYKFGTSLSEIRAAVAKAEESKYKNQLKTAGVDFAGGRPYTNPYVTLRTGLDVWVEGHISRYNDDIGGIDREGDFRILYVGADYVVAPGVLLGVLAQVDDTEEDIDDPDRRGEIDGTGWMVGPYVGVRLTNTLFFDARAAWGESDNDIVLDDPVFGRRSGSFDTERWLATASLTGNYYYGPWRFSPQLGLAYGHESSDRYRTSLGDIVNGQEADIGRLTGTAEVGYRIERPDGTIVEPHLALTGIWNFDSDDLTINGTQFESDESRARIEGGVMVRMQNGLGIRAAGNYDGIGGDDFESYGGSLWINVPLD